ncbi:MAG: hypothetical protein AAGC78_13755 [Cellvibrio sp.]|uniref:hypothetical protein n=1 Tax=Cellvibrio sp. TaxID=1965322 RepID=UPI00319EE6F1
MQHTAPFVRLMAIAILASSLFACSSNKIVRQADAWPADMPTRAYFLKVYEADEANKKIQTQDEYLTWIVRFYSGWELYRRGWIKMTNELVDQVDDQSQVKEIRYKVDRIGRLVSGEWAKKSDTRTIYLRHVSIWGNALLESLDRDQALPLINRVNQDVDDLLAHRIHADVITAERYFPADKDDPFL